MEKHRLHGQHGNSHITSIDAIEHVSFDDGGKLGFKHEHDGAKHVVGADRFGCTVVRHDPDDGIHHAIFDMGYGKDGPFTGLTAVHIPPTHYVPPKKDGA